MAGFQPVGVEVSLTFSLPFDSGRYTKTGKLRHSRVTVLHKCGVAPANLGSDFESPDFLGWVYFQLFKYVALSFRQFCVL